VREPPAAAVGRRVERLVVRADEGEAVFGDSLVKLAQRTVRRIFRLR
jgi:hypothetical protein